MIIDLTQMQPGETGIVKEIQGGHGFARKIYSMGMRPGKRISKVSSNFWHGPQTIQIENMQIAIGFGMSKKVLVIVER